MMNVEKEVEEEEMPIPDYAEGSRILLIEPNMASRRHVIPLLQAATYRVKSTGFANAALSMIRAQPNAYDLVVASTKMQGMDCVTFLRTLKIFSKIPVVLISNMVNNQLAIKALKLGVCQFFERPILRNEARCLWQNVYSKGKKKGAKNQEKDQLNNNQSDNNNNNNNTDKLAMDHKGKRIQTEFPRKGKQNDKEMKKRKRSDYDDKPETSAAAAQRKNMKFNNGKAIPTTRQQDVGNADMFFAQHGKTTGHPNSETVQNPKLNLGKNNFNLFNNHNHMVVNEIINRRINHIRHEYWTDTQPGVFIANYGYHGSSSSDLGYYSPSSARPLQKARSSENNVQPMMQSYYTTLQTETTRFFQTENLPYSYSNYYNMRPSDSRLPYEAIQPINDVVRENLEEFEVMCSAQQNLKFAHPQKPTEDDLIFEGILAELQDDFLTNNDLRSLGFRDNTDL